MFVAIVSFIVNLATALLLFLVSIGDLTSARFFTTFHFLKIAYTTGDGPKSGWLDTQYNVLTFGLWNYCEGLDNVINACIDPKIGYTLDAIPTLNQVDQHYVSNTVRSFNKVTVLFIPATCVAFLAFVLSAIALSPRFRKRFLHGFIGFLMFLVTICCILLMIVVFTVNVSRKIHFEAHLEPPVKASLGPGMWITLALVPLTVLGSLFNAFAVCCPGRFERRSKNLPDSKEEITEPSL
ncbi:hypothetical protein BGZ79_007974 [Entomortierella chlamydospora]|nr:hypothetical protein BGZ79_007974 [Entomortierella chlamydospora]